MKLLWSEWCVTCVQVQCSCLLWRSSRGWSICGESVHGRGFALSNGAYAGACLTCYVFVVVGVEELHEAEMIGLQSARL